MRESTPTRCEVPANSVLLVEDDRLMAEALVAALTLAGVDVVGSAPSGREAFEALREVVPSAVLIDLRLPDGAGLQFGRLMLGRVPELRLVALSTDEGRGEVRELERAGFGGCVSKHSGIAQIIAALDPGRGTGVWEATGPPRRTHGGGDTDFDRLTRREREVLSLLSQGFRTQMIADRLEVELNTVRSHVQTILSKLQVHSRFEAVALVLGL